MSENRTYIFLQRGYHLKGLFEEVLKCPNLNFEHFGTEVSILLHYESNNM